MSCSLGWGLFGEIKIERPGNCKVYVFLMVQILVVFKNG